MSDIDELAQEYWTFYLDEQPTSAHILGIYGGAGRFEEVSREAEDREIEEFLYAHPDIEDVQVVGVPDERYGEELCAWVKLRSGAEPLDEAKVREFCSGRLSHYKIPRYVMVVDEFTMTVTGKIRKVQMREETAAHLGLG